MSDPNERSVIARALVGTSSGAPDRIDETTAPTDNLAGILRNAVVLFDAGVTCSDTVHFPPQPKPIGRVSIVHTPHVKPGQTVAGRAK